MSDRTGDAEVVIFFSFAFDCCVRSHGESIQKVVKRLKLDSEACTDAV